MKKNRNKELTVMYANIQGFRGKKTSLINAMESTKADVVMLTETMTKNVSIDGCQCINPKVSTGQNVSIILVGKCCVGSKKMKLYEPNESVNMLGIRVAVNKTGIRFYTAHLKQQSANSREDIKVQFDEIKNQFRSSNMGCEPMLMICDANVHVGGDVIPGCCDAQDWGGKELFSMLSEEGLILVNSRDICDGIVTRVDPRNGSVSTIDLAICNSYMIDRISSMKIDQRGDLTLQKYGKVTTSTDHNTIILKLNVPKCNRTKIEKVVKYNTRNADARERMKLEIQSDVVIDNLFRDQTADVNGEVEKLFCRWNCAMKRSFHTVKPNKMTLRGVDDEIKLLLREERWIRENIVTNPERGRRIAETQKLIAEKIAENMSCEVEQKVNQIIQSDRPQSKVFNVRRKMKQTTNLDFPLKDKNGVVQVSKEAIDQIISEHFKKVFAQNEVPSEEVWEEYWGCVDSVFDLIDNVTKDEYDPADEPTLAEIEKIVNGLKESKASYGTMSIDLVKLCDSTMVHVIHRCILMCFRQNVFPEAFQIEKMTLLLKNKGLIENINDYRGIFLRYVIVSVYQKWLYERNAPIVDGNGSEYACGGRKERSCMEALLIVKLIQDYSNWTKTPMILKFLDVEKFFDSMNFKKSLIEAYRCGVKGRFWQSYKTINLKRQCIPHIPSGACSSIEMDEVFVQGSCDAVLMAWPIMDAESKQKGDLFSSTCYIEGIPIDRISFVDDLAEFAKSENDTDEKSVSNEVFEKKTRLNFKISKCKVIAMNYKGTPDLNLDNEKMEVLEDHVYLGTIISRNGNRVKDMNDRLNKSKSVANEIVQVCKETELANVRLMYVKLLINSCLDSKIKYGCALWNILRSKMATQDLNKMKPALIKRVLQLPSSTPSDAILYEFGITDLSLDILGEKVILAAETLNRSEDRIATKLLKAMIKKGVPGFCSEVLDVCEIFGVSLDDFEGSCDVRKKVKEKIIEIQRVELCKRMLVCSKTNKVLLSGFQFDGSVKPYLLEHSFEHARAIFMIRYRMLPTKSNFPGRWVGNLCNVCGFEDTDAHLFECPGYQDIISDDIWFHMFWDDNILKDTVKMKKAASILVSVIERLEVLQNMVISGK